MPALTLTKHHGLGNDFLVLLDPDDLHPVDGETARALCHRSRGVGADGLIRSTLAVDGTPTMELYNADGSRAEMSGNGISCLVQALVDAGVVPGPEVEVLTDAGVRTVRYADGRATVAMGEALVKPEGDGLSVDVGNPHLVLRDEGQDLLAVGAERPDVNVELVAAAPDGVAMRVHERGVGPTDACGTGAVAAAVAAHLWGMAGEHVVVHQPGGDAEVDLSGREAQLTVPVVYVARIEVPCL
jgi:diaminopimelate epimerase